MKMWQGAFKSSRLFRRYKEWTATICFSLAALVVALICAMGFLAYSGALNFIRNLYGEVGHDLVERHVEYLDGFFSEYFDDLRKFSEMAELKDADSRFAMEALARSVPEKRRALAVAAFASIDGNARYVDGRELDVSQEKFFAKAIESDGEFVVELYDADFGGVGEFVIAKGVLADDECVGVVFYSMRFSSLESPVSGMSIGDVFSGFVIASSGEFIVPLKTESILNIGEDSLGQGDFEILRNLLSKMEENARGSSILRSRVFPDEFVEWAKIDGTDWIIALSAPFSKIDLEARDFKVRVTVICGVLIVAVLVASVLIFLSILRKHFSHRLTLQQVQDIDELTGLWTEAFFEEQAEKLLNKNPESNYLILGLDIRGFRIVQQTEGIPAANEQLIRLSRRLGEIAREKKGIVARGHIDHFYLMYPISDSESAIREFDSLLYNGNFLAGRVGELVPTKAGIVFAGKDYEHDTIQNLIGKTSYAKHMVQDNLLKNYSVYDSSMETRILYEKRLERYIPIAFAHNEFYVVYQPKINLSDGKIIGAEALVRWKSAELGNVTPDNFIPLFERNGYINRLDFYVYQKVFEFMETQITERKKELVPISVNMSRFHLNDERFVSKFSNLFREYNIPSQMIEVEILERSLGVADDRAREVAEQLHEMGFRVAIDDFGTGESSLSLISKVPADILKLDRKFMLGVQDASSSSDDELKVVRQIVEMARQLGKETICEGVETEQQVNFLRSINCNYVQGFFYSKPLSEKEFVEYLEQHL
ncbi:MAG: EAL domain-containing protein [Treponemataceae bacterium]|nr:EAL domain-containing protein [Treponemataceae bacterium]